MFLVVKDSRVIVGPMAWNKAFYEGRLKEHGCVVNLERKEPADEAFPYIIDETFRIVKCVQEFAEHNEKIQYLHGPFWNFDADVAVGTYQVMDIPVEQVKQKLVNETAAERYNKEIAGVTATIQGMEVTIDTSRDGRNIFVQQYLLMGENDTTQWKFPEGWLTLTKSDLGIAVAAGVAHIQGAFDWEKATADTINTSVDNTALDAIVIVEPEPEPE
jgi:hypothetical protein